MNPFIDPKSNLSRKRKSFDHHREARTMNSTYQDRKWWYRLLTPAIYLAATEKKFIGGDQYLIVVGSTCTRRWGNGYRPAARGDNEDGKFYHHLEFKHWWIEQAVASRDKNGKRYWSCAWGRLYFTAFLRRSYWSTMFLHPRNDMGSHGRNPPWMRQPTKWQSQSPWMKWAGTAASTALSSSTNGQDHNRENPPAGKQMHRHEQRCYDEWKSWKRHWSRFAQQERKKETMKIEFLVVPCNVINENQVP